MEYREHFRGSLCGDGILSLLFEDVRSKGYIKQLMNSENHCEVRLKNTVRCSHVYQKLEISFVSET